MIEDDITIEDLELEENLFKLTGLPDEIILRIFSHLTMSEIFKKVALVCCQFHRISKDPSVIKEIYYRPNLDTSQQIYITDALTRSRELRSLTLRGVSDHSDAEYLLSTVTKSCHKLETLKVIHFSKLSDDCISSLVESKVAHSLKHLNLECTSISTHWGTSQLIKLKNLTKLNLFNLRLFDSEHLKALAFNCEHLEYLNLEEVTHLSEDSVITLIQERQKTLKCLYLDGESLSDQTFGNLFLCQKLQELGISFAEEMDENGILSISKLNQLKVLKLKRAKKVKADDFVTLFANKNLCKLQNLDLSECVQVNDEVIKTLAIECPLLEKVMLNWCWDIRDSGLEFLIRYSRNIIRLHLVGVVLLTDEFLKEISEHLPYLLHLDLQQCPNITDTNLEDLVEKSEIDLEIVNYYGEIIEPFDSADILFKKQIQSDNEKSSTTTEGAVCEDNISEGFPEN